MVCPSCRATYAFGDVCPACDVALGGAAAVDSVVPERFLPPRPPVLRALLWVAALAAVSLVVFLAVFALLMPR